MANRGKVLAVTVYNQRMRRNCELEQIIQTLKKEQERNDLKALKLVVKYPELAKIHKSTS